MVLLSTAWAYIPRSDASATALSILAGATVFWVLLKALRHKAPKELEIVIPSELQVVRPRNITAASSSAWLAYVQNVRIVNRTDELVVLDVDFHIKLSNGRVYPANASNWCELGIKDGALPSSMTLLPNPVKVALRSAVDGCLGVLILPADGLDADLPQIRRREADGTFTPSHLVFHELLTDKKFAVDAPGSRLTAQRRRWI